MTILYQVTSFLASIILSVCQAASIFFSTWEMEVDANLPLTQVIPSLEILPGIFPLEIRAAFHLDSTFGAEARISDRRKAL